MKKPAIHSIIYFGLFAAFIFGGIYKIDCALDIAAFVSWVLIIRRILLLTFLNFEDARARLMPVVNVYGLALAVVLAGAGWVFTAVVFGAVEIALIAKIKTTEKTSKTLNEVKHANN